MGNVRPAPLGRRRVRRGRRGADAEHRPPGGTRGVVRERLLRLPAVLAGAGELAHRHLSPHSPAVQQLCPLARGGRRVLPVRPGGDHRRSAEGAWLPVRQRRGAGYPHRPADRTADRGARTDRALRPHHLRGATATTARMLGNHGFVEKALMYEESVRVPCLLSWPEAIPAGQHGGSIRRRDLCPTLLDLAGAPLPDALEGRSVAAAITTWRGPGPGARCSPSWPTRRRFTAATVVPAQCAAHVMVLDGDWKYVWNRFELDELYDLAADPAEMDNRAEIAIRAHSAWLRCGSSSWPCWSATAPACSSGAPGGCRISAGFQCRPVGPEAAP